jgi:hypothetical protein
MEPTNQHSFQHCKKHMLPTMMMVGKLMTMAGSEEGDVAK